MENSSARPSDGPMLQPMDPDQARYHCMILRAIADLLESGEPVEFATFHAAVVGQSATVRITLNQEHLSDAERMVHQRVQANDETYVIRVQPREPSRPTGFPRRRR